MKNNKITLLSILFTVLLGNKVLGQGVELNGVVYFKDKTVFSFDKIATFGSPGMSGNFMYFTEHPVEIDFTFPIEVKIAFKNIKSIKFLDEYETAEKRFITIATGNEVPTPLS